MADHRYRQTDWRAGAGRWALDAAYTPIATPFPCAAHAAGRELLSGFELFLHPGIDAFRPFTGLAVDAARLRAARAQVAAVPDPLQPRATTPP